ncbi:Clavaminate synthase-like protein [Canariomyces notabilis]|uniref:Clavaminate synthase-like protein n=1 Tax=Canariomyces notabilis TaxID=2074819 RepID=A0AAN6TAP4_9PEZI|nr:Clavaminate synthase-like protein [Canariomyces arenarius]
MAKIASIPVIDISGEGDQTQVAKDLVEAAIEHGFIYIKNLGKDIPVEAIEGAFEMSKKLFNAPLSEKRACTIRHNNRGWSAMQYETLDPGNQRVSHPLLLLITVVSLTDNPQTGDLKEAFNFGPFINSKAQQPLPPTLTGEDEAAIGAFRDLCEKLCLKLTTLLGLGLEVDPPDFFTSAHLTSPDRPSGTILRFLYYPPHEQLPAREAVDRAADVRAGAHSDYGSMTLLFRLRGQAGLEILGRDGKSWSPVPVVPPGTEEDPGPPVLLNIGDLLAYWTGGLLRSTVHRVVFAGGRDTEPRYSIAFFFHPWGGAELGVVPSQRVREFAERGDAKAEGNPYAERKVLTADEHLQMRLRASYAQLYKDKA